MIIPMRGVFENCITVSARWART